MHLMKRDLLPEGQSKPARLLIADDQELVRVGLRSMLAGERWLEIVGEATNGHEALELCRRLQPDLALLDVRMPELDGLAATRAIRQACPETRVLIVTTHESTEYLLAALNAGAAGYLLKDATRPELIAAVRQVLRGESSLNGELAARALQRLASARADPTAALPERLTRREQEVLRLLAEGLTNREIAHSLTISVGTVKIHVEHIIAKLGVADRTQAAVRAVELGLLEPQTW
jgi:DNA-binding NarL/FixJ family response regulator